MFEQPEDVVEVRREMVSLLRKQLEALDSVDGLTDAKLMECYERQARVQELRDKLESISGGKDMPRAHALAEVAIAGNAELSDAPSSVCL